MAQASLHFSFSGRRVLVTGGASGIGRGIVSAFYADGASVFVLDRNAEALAKVKRELAPDDPRFTTICVDLMNWGETRAAVEGCGPLDHLVNNAGVLDVCPLMQVTEESFDKTVGVNLKAVLNVSQVFVKGVLERGAGAGVGGATIVNLSSVADTAAWRGCGTYSATKAGVAMLTKTMALEFGELAKNSGDGGARPPIRVNCIRPGLVRTNLFDGLPKELSGQIVSVLGERAIANHREMVPSDIANGVLFLSSPLSEMITGAVIPIDQGLTVT